MWSILDYLALFGTSLALFDTVWHCFDTVLDPFWDTVLDRSGTPFLTRPRNTVYGSLAHCIWVPGTLYMGPWHCIYHWLGPGNTGGLYPGSTTPLPRVHLPPTHRTRCTGQHPAGPDLNA